MASEQTRKRNANRDRVLRSLHFEGAQRRADLSRRCAIRKTSVTNIVAELLERGIVVEEEPGARRSRVALDRTRFHVLAADVAPGSVRLARVFLDGHEEDREEHAVTPPLDPADVAKALAMRFDAMARGRDGATGRAGATARGRTDVLGAAVAVPGLVDPVRGVVTYSVRLGQWRDVPLRDLLGERAGGPVLIENDVRCQLWACAWFERLLALYDSILYLGLLNGVACATILHGRRVLGGRFAAGEIGHVRAGDRGRLCGCGKTDCLETYASVPAILNELLALRPGSPLGTAAEVVRAAAKDQAVGNVLDRVAQRLARALSGTLAAFDPDALIIGSADREFSLLLRPFLLWHLRAELAGLAAREVEVLVAGPAGRTSLQGAAGLVMARTFSSGWSG